MKEFTGPNNKKVSVIVPIYNAEKYLEQCIQSVLLQTYDNLELILVDDGSCDNSFAICMDYLRNDKRVKVYHKQNGGVSETRNLGIKKSQGNYIIFLDSDDYWLSDKVVESMVAKAEGNNLDLVRCGYVRVSENGNVLTELCRNRKSTDEKEVYNSFGMVNDVMRGEYFSVLFLIKAEIVRRYSFDKSLVFGEDMYFLSQLFCEDLRCGNMLMKCYAYRQTDTCVSKKTDINKIINSFSFCDRFYELSRKASNKQLLQLYVYNSIMMYYWTLGTVSSNEYINKYKEIDEAVNLNEIQRATYLRTKKYKFKIFPLQIYVNPVLGIRLFRLKWNIGKFLRFLRIK